MTQIFRFAPSPNGLLHLGHAASALLNAARARETGGRLLLRIEDIDVSRCRPEFEAAIYEDLAWLGLAWETPVRRQSEHFADYRAALQKLDAMGVLYPAFESRAEIARLVAERDAAAREETGPWPRDPDGAPLYPGDAKHMPAAERAARLAAGAPHVLRLDLEAALAALGPRAKALAWEERGAGPAGETGTVAARPDAWGDVVVARKDVPASYHLAVVVDDAVQGVTEVVRGRDLFSATSVHRVLQALLGLPAPVYRHHGLVLDADGHKLSKSTGATGLRAQRAAGQTPADIRRLIEPVV
ncbi:tRNA glutamyl-Q(34) synthetase GluQRS [Rhodoplanes sp. SY1]|uniref:tRNA glutamyl-Q(34) synthetase GluQRS n=1 Tax=Rhodoplanes sp. SY1 TaxID=3166646 RepID=UPI0038B63E43